MVVVIFFYSKQAIIEVKQLELRTKSPLFNLFSETINGLIPITIYQRTQELKQKFSKLLNESIRCTAIFWAMSRGFASYVNMITILVLTAGIIVGISNSTD